MLSLQKVSEAYKSWPYTHNWRKIMLIGKWTCSRALKQHLQLNKSIFMYKYFSGFLPEYLNDLLPKIKDTKYASSRCTISMPGPTPRIDLVQTSLCFSGGILWEKLPSELRNASSLLTFKNLAYRFFCENV